jgi:hypothetical protein
VQIEEFFPETETYHAHALLLFFHFVELEFPFLGTTH